MEIWTKTPILIKIPINISLMSYYWFYVKNMGALFEKCWKSLKKKPTRGKSTINIPLSGPYWYDEILRLWHSCRCQLRPLFQPCPAWYQSQCNSQFVQHQHCKKLNKPKELQEHIYATLNKDPFGFQIGGIKVISQSTRHNLYILYKHLLLYKKLPVEYIVWYKLKIEIRVPNQMT